MPKKRALVTGSSRGIGAAIARRLAREGYHVLIHCTQNLEKANLVLTQIREAGGSGEILQADLCQLDQTMSLAKAAGNVDVLVLNASVQIRSPWQQITPEQCQIQLNCNLVSSLLLIQGVVEHMKVQKWGRIIAIGSVQEAKPHPDMLVYSASKAAQSNMVRSLALQLAEYGVTVNCVAPGVIYTDRNQEVLADPVYAKKVTDSIPMGYYGQPEDIAGIAAMLASDEGRYITGQTVYVDGGKGIL